MTRHITPPDDQGQPSPSARENCVDRHDTDPPDADVGHLCGEHFAQLRSSLLEIPAVATWLEVNIAAGGQADGERVAGSREDPIPLRPDVLDLVGPDSIRYVIDGNQPSFLLWDGARLLAEYGTWSEAATARRDAINAAGDVDDEAARVRWQVRPTARGGLDQRGVDAFRAALHHWASRVAEETGIPRPVAHTDLTTLVGWLAARLSWIAGQPWVGEMADDVRRLLGQAHRVAPWRPVLVRDDSPCTVCAAPAVVLHLAEGVSRCEKRAGGCGRSSALSDYVLDAVLPKVRRAG